ncbi:MAG: phosphoglycerate dehydrogenase [Clostridiales bacterium]|jgi:D-3-phosphoglycerate dehydrogenase|nr:phosphoglycerate dehydrogenase [Bacillota bacterium]NLH59362.1 phosphoglycerate dehydrogenase [Clostridiales bacterium]
MYNIKLMNKISDIIYDNLPKDKFNVSDSIDDPHGIIVRSANLHDMELPPSLMAIARAGAGVNNIPIDKCTDKGIVVFNTPGANANAVKELVIGALIMSSRKLYQGITWVESQKESKEDIAKLVEKEKSKFSGPEIKGKKLGVIGLGAIGALVANDASAIGMKVTGYDPHISVKAAWALSPSVKRAQSLDQLLEESDYISIHIPLMAETRNYISKDTISKMKKGVRILNFSRGELVNTQDIINALKDGSVGCYVTDFPNEDLIDVDNAILVPHLGASTPESEDNCADMASTELRSFLETGNIVNSVNFPNCEMQKTSKLRITISHKNVPNMVGQIASGLAKHHINISDMVNKSRESIAYTMIDIEGELTQDIISQIENIDGVIKVRVINSK